MKKAILTCLILISTIMAYCQTKDSMPELNFDFELVQNGIPLSWDNFGSADYKLSLDSTVVKNGKYAASIEYLGEKPEFRAWSFTIPDNYPGKKITLSGYIKTENVTGGFAGIWMRIDPSIAFDNMSKKGLKGTTDWTKYEITLDMDPENTKQIVFGGVMAGKGKMWIDQFTVTIDGKNIKDLKPLEKKVFPAEKDLEFNTGSGITISSVNENQIENLRVLGLIWGFLKYYHPNIAKGEYNWDYELFRILPKVLNAENEKSRDEVLTKWIAGFGTYPEGKETKINPSETKIVPDLEWIKTSNFSDKLTGSLLKIKNAKRPKEHYYIGLTSLGGAEFKHENKYSEMVYPDAGFRLLALYRYWNMIQYYFPNKGLIEEDWKCVLNEFVPKVITDGNETEYTLTMLELIGRIHDTHANIWGSNKVLKNYLGLRYAPLELTFIENQALVTNYHDDQLGKETGLKVGDIITSINDKPVAEMVKERLNLSPASNYPTKLRNIAAELLRTNDTTISVGFIRNDKEEKAVLKAFNPKEMQLRSKYDDRDTCFRMITKDIAYINNGSVKREYLSKIWEEVKNTKGLIIDDRNYPSDFVLFDLMGYLMPKSTPFVKFSEGNITTPGLFTFKYTTEAGKKNNDYYKGKVIILVNELTQSSAEYHALAYRVHPNATVVGSTTAGADGNVSEISIPGGIMSWISGIGVYYPDGRETQRIGIVPDIEIKPTIQGIKEGRDEVLEKAIQIIKGI
jgi:C-terminal processing protease CtpA/Prc